MGMPENHRAPGTDEIDIFLSLDIEDPTPFCSRDESGGSSNGTKTSYRTVHAAGNELASLFEESLVVTVRHPGSCS